MWYLFKIALVSKNIWLYLHSCDFSQFCLYPIERETLTLTVRGSTLVFRIWRHVDVRFWCLKSILLCKSKNIYNGRRPLTYVFKWIGKTWLRYLWRFQIEKTLWSPWFIRKYFTAFRVKWDDSRQVPLVQSLVVPRREHKAQLNNCDKN